MFAPLLACSLAMCLQDAYSQIRLDQLYQSWERAQAEFRNLTVEFTINHEDRAFKEEMQSKCKLQLCRSGRGCYLGRCEVTEVNDRTEITKCLHALLIDDRIYVLMSEEKIAIRLDLPGKEMLSFLERWFNPFVALLDQSAARTRFRLTIEREDKWYTYLTARPRESKQRPPGCGWSFWTSGKVALMRVQSDHIPMDMPRMLRVAAGWAGLPAMRYEVTKWRFNDPQGPTEKEFIEPEKLPGWAVAPDPFSRSAR